MHTSRFFKCRFHEGPAVDSRRVRVCVGARAEQVVVRREISPVSDHVVNSLLVLLEERCDGGHVHTDFQSRLSHDTVV